MDRTILFADVCGSTRIIEALGDRAGEALILDMLRNFEEATERYQGTVIKTIGDEVLSAFESPLEAITAAIDMQRAHVARKVFPELQQEIRIGLHSGPVISHEGDVFGDVVNAAARVVALAAGGQVLATAQTLSLFDSSAIPFRSLGKHNLKGRAQRWEICEVLWRGETAQLTTVVPKLPLSGASELELTFEGKSISLSSEEIEPLTLGRGGQSTLTVPDTEASRLHAKITARNGRFYLIDQSTNGTYLRPEGGTETFVHRDEIILQGKGAIRMGGGFSEKGPTDIEYRIR